MPEELLTELIDELRRDRTEDAQRLCAMLLCIRGAMCIPASFLRLSDMMERFGKDQLESLKGRS